MSTLTVQSFATKEDLDSYIKEKEKFEQEETERAEEDRTRYMENEQAAEEVRVARELFERNQEVEAVKSFFNQAERRVHGDRQRTPPGSSSTAVQGEHSAESSLKSSQGSDMSKGEEDWSTRSSSPFDTALELRPSKTPKVGRGTGTMHKQGAGIPRTGRRGKPNSIDLSRLHTLIQRVENVQGTFSRDKQAHLRTAVDVVELVFGRLAYT